MSKTRWQTIERTASDEYDIGNAMYNKANEYFLLTSIATNNDNYPVALLPTIQLAMECYLKSVIESINNKSISKIYADKSEICPHNLRVLYSTIYPKDNKQARNPLLPGYDNEFKKTLDGVFSDFQATRFPIDIYSKDSYKSKEVTEDSVQYDVEILKDVKDRVETFRENLREQQQAEQQDGPEEE